MKFKGNCVSWDFGVLLWLQIKHLHVDAIVTSQALTDKVLSFVFFKLTYVNFLLKFSLFRLQIAPFLSLSVLINETTKITFYSTFRLFEIEKILYFK